MTPTGSQMHVACVAEIPLGREMAHAINAFKTAGGFARIGCRVTLFCLPPLKGGVADALAVYGEHSLDVHLIEPIGAEGSDDRARDFAERAAAAAARLGCDGIYGRHFHVGLTGPRHGIPTAIETHAHVGDERPLLDEVFAATRHADHPLRAIITIAPMLRDHYIARGANPDRVHLVPDAADPALFSPPPGRTPRASRARPRLLYSGHLYDYKGIPTLIEAARMAPDLDWVLMGGTVADVERTRAASSGMRHVLVLGRVPHCQVPSHLWDADVLLLPPSARHPSANWTSPLKLAEYLWADRPIVASRIQGLANWIDQPAVRWFTPDDPCDLVRCIRSVLASPDRDRQAARADRSRYAERFTYANRARSIAGTLDVATRAPAGGGA